MTVNENRHKCGGQFWRPGFPKAQAWQSHNDNSTEVASLSFPVFGGQSVPWMVTTELWPVFMWLAPQHWTFLLLSLMKTLDIGLPNMKYLKIFNESMPVQVPFPNKIRFTGSQC